MRKVRSFVRRAGRLSDGQKAALTTLAPQWLLPFVAEHRFDWLAVFGNAQPVILEIGFGMGHSLLTHALQQPHHNFLGIEVHQAGIGSVLAGIQAQQLTNLKIMDHDAVEVLRQMIPDHSLHGVQIFFPDPWPKKRHHKRRLLQSAFVQLLCQKLQPGGFIHCATDWQPYAEDMLMVFRENQQLINQSPSEDYIERPAHRPLTKFEQRGLNLGHGVWDLLFVKKS